MANSSDDLLRAAFWGTVAMFTTGIMFGPDFALTPFIAATEATSTVAVTLFGAVARVIPLVVAGVAAWIVWSLYRYQKRYPATTFGKRYYETDRPGEVDICINCNASDDHGVVTVCRRVWVVLGAVVWTEDSVEIEECSTCAKIEDPIDYALRAGEAEPLRERFEDENPVSLDARDRERSLEEIFGDA